MDIKQKITEIVDKIKSNPTLMADFKKEPEQTVEKLIGVDIPDGVADKVVDGVKAALASDKISGLVGKVKGLF